MKILSAISTISMCIALSACGVEDHSVKNQDTMQVSTAEQKSAENAPEFMRNNVTYLGKRSAGGMVDAFLGVPFAQPPAGELRWMPPQPLHENKQSDSGKKIAVQKYAPACMQGPHMIKWYKGVISSFGGDPETFPVPEVSEDCLYLNIWRPHVSASQSQDALPVFVFIHGGSNKGGWSYEPNYVGEQLAKRGVIVVTVAYRVGALGFFAHPQLEHTNFALFDQIAALRWIHNNIKAVGGDPANVTVAGESAGANDIEYLLTSPLADGLFQRVIHQSGGSSMLDRSSKEKAAELGEQLASKVLGIESAGTFDGMREIPAQTILTAVGEVYAEQYFDPVIDGRSVSMSVRDAVEKGAVPNIDLLIGSNADEWTIYLDPAETVAAWLSKNLSESDAQAMINLLDSDSIYKNESPAKHLDRLITAQNFVCPSLKLAQAVSMAGGQSWVYYFAKVREGALAATMGAYHGAELPYVFNTHDDWLPTDAADHELTDSLMNYWVQFMKTGNPNTAGLPEWPAYSNTGDPVQNLNTLIKPETHSSQKLCEILMP